MPGNIQNEIKPNLYAQSAHGPARETNIKSVLKTSKQGVLRGQGGNHQMRKALERR